MRTTITERRVARLVGLFALLAMLFLVALPATSVVSAATAAPAGDAVVAFDQEVGDPGEEIGAAEGGDCDREVATSLPGGLNFVVLNKAACDTLGDYTNAYATVMTLFSIIIAFWFVVVVGRLGAAVIRRSYNDEDLDATTTANFFKQLAVSAGIALIGFILISRGMNMLLGLGNGAFEMLVIESKDSYLVKFGGPIGGLLLTLQNAASMLLLLIGVPIGAWRFIRAYNKVNASGSDYGVLTGALKEVGFYFVMILGAWLLVRYGINMIVDLYANVGNELDNSMTG